MPDPVPEIEELIRQTDRLLEEMVDQQRARLIRLGRRIDPGLSFEDLLQPQDHPRIAVDPRFNFEDGVLAGLIGARTALRASFAALGRRQAEGS